MADADLGRAAADAFDVECDRMYDAVLIALAPKDKVSIMPHERLVIHHHAAIATLSQAIATLSQVIADMIQAVPDAEMRKHLRTAVLTVITPDPRSKELH